MSKPFPERYPSYPQPSDIDGPGVPFVPQMTNDCEDCKYWSELCARSIGCGPMEALCLNPNSPRYNRMVYDGCGEYTAGRSVDCP